MRVIAMPTTDASDDIPVASDFPYASGAAALSLVESLLHHLVNRSVMSLADAIDVVQIATDAQAEISLERGDESATKPDAVTLLSAISASLAIDAF